MKFIFVSERSLRYTPDGQKNMEEQEVPTEGLSEKINEQAEKEKDWSFYIAISTALIAVLAF